MKSVFITNLQAGDSLENEAFLIQDCVLRKTKDDRAYLLGNLRDKSGQISFVFWDVPDYVQAWTNPGKIILVTGRVNNYKEALQINITDLNKSQNPDMAAFLPASQRSREAMVAELRDVVSGLETPWRHLVSALLLEDEAFLLQFANAPAARKMHHAYIGGLIEHSLSMANLAQQLAGHYPYINKDLLVAGALLHDMGKAIEYEIEGSFTFSEDGRLVGHIVRAVVMVEQAAATLGDIPEDDLRQLVHLITSHHGTYEWGSPAVPKTIEAVLLHQIDLLDSRVQGFFDHLRDDASGNTWTNKGSLMFGTELRYPDGFAEDALSAQE